MESFTVGELADLVKALLEAQTGAYAPASTIQIAEMAADAGWLSDGQWTRAVPVGSM